LLRAGDGFQKLLERRNDHTDQVLGPPWKGKKKKKEKTKG